MEWFKEMFFFGLATLSGAGALICLASGFILLTENVSRLKSKLFLFLLFIPFGLICMFSLNESLKLENKKLAEIEKSTTYNEISETMEQEINFFCDDLYTKNSKQLNCKSSILSELKTRKLFVWF